MRSPPPPAHRLGNRLESYVPMHTQQGMHRMCGALRPCAVFSYTYTCAPAWPPQPRHPTDGAGRPRKTSRGRPRPPPGQSRPPPHPRRPRRRHTRTGSAASPPRTPRRQKRSERRRPPKTQIRVANGGGHPLLTTAPAWTQPRGAAPPPIWPHAPPRLGPRGAGGGRHQLRPAVEEPPVAPGGGGATSCARGWGRHQMRPGVGAAPPDAPAAPPPPAAVPCIKHAADAKAPCPAQWV